MPTSDDAASPAIADLLLWIGVAGPVAFVALALLEGWARAGYSTIRHPVSALALGPRGRLQIGNFAVCGLAVMAGAMGILLQGTGPVLAAGVAVFGFGLVASAVPMDPMRGYPPGTPEGDPDETSRAHVIHDAAGAVVFFSLPVVAVIAAFTLTGWWWSAAAGSMAVLLCLAAAAFSTAWETDSPRTGLVQRLFIVPGWLWLASVFVYAAAG